MKLVVFDIDGTLLKVSDTEAAAFRTALKEHCGIEKVNTDWNIYKNKTDTGIVYEILEKHQGYVPSSAQIFEILNTYAFYLKKEWNCKQCSGAEIKGASQFLNTLDSMESVMMTIATGNFKKVAKLKLAWFKMEKYFKGGGFADDSYKRTEILKASLKRANEINKGYFKRKNIFFIGDRVDDFKSAKALGINFIGICGNKKKNQQLLAEGATIIFPNYVDREKIMNVLFL